MIYHFRGSCILFAIVFSYPKTNTGMSLAKCCTIGPLKKPLVNANMSAVNGQETAAATEAANFWLNKGYTDVG